jgi:hypothetical protein
VRADTRERQRAVMLPEKTPRSTMRKDFIEKYYGLHFIELSALTQMAHSPVGQAHGMILWKLAAGIVSSCFEFFTAQGVSLILPRRSLTYPLIGTHVSHGLPGIAASTTRRNEETKAIPKRNQERMYGKM